MDFQVNGDWFQGIAAQKHALQCVEHGGDEPVFMYRFDHFNPKMYGLFGMKFPFFGTYWTLALSQSMGNIFQMHHTWLTSVSFSQLAFLVHLNSQKMTRNSLKR